MESPGDTERKRGSLALAWDLGFLLMIVAWYMCPLMHPGTGHNKDRA